MQKAKQVKLSTVIKAEAEAKAIELIGEAVKRDPGFIQMRKIQVCLSCAAGSEFSCPVRKLLLSCLRR